MLTEVLWLLSAVAASSELHGFIRKVGSFVPGLMSEYDLSLSVFCIFFLGISPLDACIFAE